MKQAKALAFIIIALGISIKANIKAFAVVDYYDIEDKSGQVYEYDKEELIDGLITSKLGFKDLLFEDFNKKLSDGRIHSFHESSGKYVDYKRLKEILIHKSLSNEEFNLDEEAEKLNRADMPEDIERVVKIEEELSICPVKAKDNSQYKNIKSSKDLYITGNNIVLEDANIDGTLFINPGIDGKSTLINVTASNIVILSGAKQGIVFKNVKSNLLTMSDEEVIRLEGTENTVIEKKLVRGSKEKHRSSDTTKVRRTISNKLKVDVDVK